MVDGDLSVIGVRLVRLDFADNGCVGYVPASARRDVVVVDNVEGVDPIDPFTNTLGPYTDALARVAHLVGLQSGPDEREAWVFAELAVRDVLASLVIENRHCLLAEECLEEDALRRYRWSDCVCQCGARPCVR